MEEPQSELEPIEFDDETLAALVELGELLRSVHDDLMAEGFQIKDGIISPPSGDL